ncbi:hypothetical protein ACIPL1_08790 [Pseudomonas sp. NPDC090202]|uniref:hypothetical protein n=1 Tax=unclassified Pseudomonas TaxID=196821 RepID=UPI00382FA9A6
MAKNPVVFIVKAEMSSLTFWKLAEKNGVRNRWLMGFIERLGGISSTDLLWEGALLAKTVGQPESQ